MLGATGMSKTAKTKLTPEQHAEAKRLEQAFREAVDGEARAIAELLASCPPERLLGETEFQVRDLLLRIGNAAFAAALTERKKGARSRRPLLPPMPGTLCPQGLPRTRGADPVRRVAFRAPALPLPKVQARLPAARPRARP